MTAYYNENDPFAADWLENLIKEGLIPDGTVDRRSIADVTAADVAGFEQAHFFAGVGGWPIALRIAGWDDSRPVWTGSCPCQPWSQAGKCEGAEDDRHLWPAMFRLIEGSKPATVFGEQVASAEVIGKANGKNGDDPAKPPVWLDGVFADLERASYASTAFDLPAACVNSPQIRQRIFWLACASGSECEWGSESTGQLGRALHSSDCSRVGRLACAGQQPSWIDVSGQGVAMCPEPPERRPEEIGEPGRHRGVNGLEHTTGNGRIERGAESSRRSVASGCGEMCPICCRAAIDAGFGRPGSICQACRMGDSSGQGSQERSGERRIQRRTGFAGEGQAVELRSPWSDFRIIPCRDNKYRRINSERGDEPLAYGVPSGVGPIVAALERMGHGPKDVKRFKRAASQLLAKARRNRVVRLRGYGNAIVDVVAAEFIRAFMEIGR